MQIGFIGLGLMGAGMASNLQKAGFKLVVHDLHSQAASRHLAAGAVWAATPREVAAQCEVVFTSLPGPREFEAVADGQEGLLEGFRPGGAHFDLTTNAPAMLRRMHDVYAQKGVSLLDAPVSGGPAGAASGRLAIWIGGDVAQYEKHRRVLEAMGDQVRYVGPIGAGAVAKLVHNCASFSVRTALAEVMALGVKAGVEPVALWQAVRAGALGRARTFDRLAGQFMSGLYEPADFALKLAHKDMTLATDLARELGVPMRMAAVAHAEMTEAMNRGWGERDSRAPMQLQLERSGVAIKADPARVQAVLDADPPYKG
jgi:3-hydroxyisobutyrate dehydrogenase